MREPESTADFSLPKARKVWVEDLRCLCPTKYPVKVVWARSPRSEGLEDCLAFCDLVKRAEPYFIIKIPGTLHRTHQCELLIHEWAHALSWFQVPLSQPHGRHWGIAYSKAYQAAGAA